MPADLVSRVSGSPRDLSDKDKAILAKQGGDSTPSDIAYEWAARLCGAPAYHYKLNTLKAELTKQNQKQNNQPIQKTKTKSRKP